MEYEDFHYPKEQKLSYISQQEVLGYISDYALHYKLHQHIKVLSLNTLERTKFTLYVNSLTDL